MLHSLIRRHLDLQPKLISEGSELQPSQAEVQSEEDDEGNESDESYSGKKNKKKTKKPKLPRQSPK